MLVFLFFFKNKFYWNVPDSTVIKTLSSGAGGVGLIPGQGAKI